MSWNYRIVEIQRGEDSWYEVQEVFYNADGSVAGYTDARIGSEYPAQIIEVLQRMIDDIRRNPDVIDPHKVIGFKALPDAHTEVPF